MDPIPGHPGAEHGAEQLALVALQPGPVRGVSPQLEDVVALRDKSQELLLLVLLDHHVPPDGEIDEHGGDVPQVGTVVHQHADLRRSQALGRLVGRRDRSALRVLAVAKPDPAHDEEGQNRDHEGPVAPQEAADAVPQGWPADQVLTGDRGARFEPLRRLGDSARLGDERVPGDGDREALVNAIVRPS